MGNKDEVDGWGRGVFYGAFGTSVELNSTRRSA